MSVVVVGAGVVGLTTAAHIQELLPSVQVTVIADKFNTETTSDGAAGLFYPASSFKGPTPSSAKDWMRYSYTYYENLLNEECGVYKLSGLVLSTDSQEYVINELLDGVVTECRPATPQELVKYRGEWKYGTFYQTLLIRCRTFLPWISERIKSKGGQIIKKTVKDLSELKDKYDVVVNCTGIQSRYLCDDEEVTPIRGQIIKMKAPNDQFVLTRNMYIIPNGDGLVSLGGIAQLGNWNGDVSEEDSEAIRSRCFVADPTLKSAPTAWEWAGLRPYRETVRVETEHRDGLKLVHNYGHGGYGVTSAPGTAQDAAKLVRQLLQAKP